MVLSRNCGSSAAERATASKQGTTRMLRQLSPLLYCSAMTFKTCLFMLCLGALCLFAIVLPAQQRVDKAMLDRWMQELSNWGRWGKDDQIGTVNLITPAKRTRADALVKEGYAVSLSSNA